MITDLSWGIFYFFYFWHKQLHYIRRIIGDISQIKMQQKVNYGGEKNGSRPNLSADQC